MTLSVSSVGPALPVLLRASLSALGHAGAAIGAIGVESIEFAVF